MRVGSYFETTPKQTNSRSCLSKYPKNMFFIGFILFLSFIDLN